MANMNSGVYEIRNIANGHIYIGSSVNVYRRICEHKSRLKNNTHPNIILQQSWKKHGESAFSFYPLLFCSYEDITAYEQKLIDKLNPKYNIAHETIRSPFYGMKHTEETRRKMSEKLKGRISPRLGVKYSDELRKKLSLAHIGKPSGKKGKKLSEESKKKISASLMGNTCALGHRLSDESKKKISDTKKARLNNKMAIGVNYE